MGYAGNRLFHGRKPIHRRMILGMARLDEISFMGVVVKVVVPFLVP